MTADEEPTYVWNIQVAILYGEGWEIYREDEDERDKDRIVEEIRVLQQLYPHREFRLVRRLVPEWEIVSLDSEE